ncbi:MAG: hypothetical protein KDB51_04375 [Propionibacteriaceae bacterium]|jgi:hypothetical protein|nr:hypothetical protein [Micropruina glycogenica]MCB0891069.1 hypothetical protein [Propionibacteriaceae bacterium]
MTQPAAPASDPIADLSKSPLPTAKTLKMRQSLPFQFTRFLSFNSRIMRMVIKGHH